MVGVPACCFTIPFAHRRTASRGPNSSERTSQGPPGVSMSWKLFSTWSGSNIPPNEGIAVKVATGKYRLMRLLRVTRAPLRA